MLANPPEPIFRIAVIRLPPMHDTVHECAIGIVDALGNDMCRLQVIVPEQEQRADKLLPFLGNFRRRQNIVECPL